MGNSTVRVVFDIVRSLVMTVLSERSWIDRFAKGIFHPERKIWPYHSKLVPIPAIANQPEEPKNKDEAEAEMIT